MTLNLAYTWHSLLRARLYFSKRPVKFVYGPFLLRRQSVAMVLPEFAPGVYDIHVRRR